MEKDNNLRHLWLGQRLATEVPKSSKKKWGKKSKIATLLIVFLLVAIIWAVFSTGSSVFTYVFSQGQPLKSTDNRVNVLLLGLAGGNHDGALLTDSIIIASYNLNNHNVTLISVPRDLWLDSIHEKVNAAYEVGLGSRGGGDGLKYAEDKIDDILGIPIHYGVRIDFNGFAQAIDQVGGVNVDIPRTFDDYEFPITGKEDDLCGYQDTTKDLSTDEAKALNVPPGKTHVYIDPGGKVATDSAVLDFSCRFQHLHFDKGPTHFDGATALNFVRSRKGNNAEGSDFARSRRQQLVLQAFRQQVLSVQTLANPAKVVGLMNALGKSVETDIPADKIPEFYKLIKDLQETQNIVLGDLGTGKSIFINPPVSDYGQWVLIPPGNDFTTVKEYIKIKLKEQDASGSASTK